MFDLSFKGNWLEVAKRGARLIGGGDIDLDNREIKRFFQGVEGGMGGTLNERRDEMEFLEEIAETELLER